MQRKRVVLLEFSIQKIEGEPNVSVLVFHNRKPATRMPFVNNKEDAIDKIISLIQAL